MDAKQHALTVLTFSRANTNRLLEDIPQDKLLHQTQDGGSHALWVMGHLAVTDDTIAGSYDSGGKKLPENYPELFGMGSKRTTDAAAYPPAGEVRERFVAARQRLLQAVETADAAVLDEALPQESRGFAPDKLGLLFSIAWHEGLHAGQLTMVRRSLGLGPKFG
ncbi:MAG: DinB family protein [Planctomycetota bacterium]|jgi:hypothetical protein